MSDSIHGLDLSKEKRVGIITFTYGNNYGQRLQNLAMQEFLKSYFDEVFTIRQNEPSISKLGRIKKILKGILTGKYYAQIARERNFKKFDDSNISFYKIKIGKGNLDTFPEEKFDYFVVGSDQVWSPYSSDVNESMFLTFTNYDKRIAISPSLACEKIPNSIVDKYVNYLNGIKYISTREYRGSDLVSSIIHRNVPTLIDPTLMFDATFWRKYEVKPKNKVSGEYCLIYCLGSSEDNEQIKELCKSLRLRTINIMHNRRYLSMGPGEFLYLVRNAKLVITDSYHGTIFSYIYRTPFLNFVRKGESVDMYSRFETLYAKFDIKPRILGDIKEKEIYSVDFEHICTSLAAEKNEFRKFLRDALNNKENKING